tara:strand:- start:3947 stop:4069 length:123 start_codon:yes stop_codon:yes gene_type:complete
MEWWGYIIWAFLLYFGYNILMQLVGIARFNINEFKERRRR